MKYLLISWLLLLSLGVSSQQLAHAQPTATMYDMVDQPPQLLSGGGTQALEEALARNFHYPTGVRPSQVNGILNLFAVVTQTGKVTTIQFDRLSDSTGISVAIHESIRAALHQLPVLAPAQLAGQPVATRMHMQWYFLRSIADSDTHMRVVIQQRNSEPELSSLSYEGDKRPSVDSDPLLERTYLYVEQMPHLPSGGGMPEVITAVQQALVVPAHAQEGRVFVSFVVDKQGQVSEPTIVKGLDNNINAAVLAAVRSLPTFIPGRRNNRPVRVSLVLPVTIYSTHKKAPAQPGKR